jgi:hypothetical protein
MQAGPILDMKMIIRWGLVFAVITLQACAQDAQKALGAAPAVAASQQSVELGSRTKALGERVVKELVHLPRGTFEMGDWGNEQGLPYDGFAEGNNRPAVSSLKCNTRHRLQCQWIVAWALWLMSCMSSAKT